MAEFRDQKAATAATADLDNAVLLGFECLEPDEEAPAEEEAAAEQAIGVALNKRGLAEGPTPKSPSAS